MSQTTSTLAAETAPKPDNAQPSASTGFFNVVLAALTKGAATIYHDVMQIESTVTKWEADHPQIAPLVNEAVAYAATFMTRLGVPVGAVILVGEDIMAALKEMAAADPTVPAVTPPSMLKGESQ